MPFCTQCGREIADSAAFCGNCGARQASSSARPSAAAPHFAPAQDPLAGLSPRTAAILCYLPTVGWIAAVVVLATRKFKGDQNVRFHAFQGLYLFATWLLVKWVVGPIMDAGSDRFIRIDHVLEGILLAVSIFMIIKASHEEAYVLPVIGELAKRSATE
jgi:uncharacterized membrane protein